jgi:hypothetical protein
MAKTVPRRLGFGLINTGTIWHNVIVRRDTD